MAKGRTNPGDVANLMVRCLLSDASELLGGWSDTDRDRTLRYFDGRCAYTGVSYDPATFVWDHLIPHNQEACGLHVYGNLVPATRAANSAKAAKDFRVFLREDHACLGDLTAEERETRIRRLEDFMLATGYAEKAAAIEGLPALCAEQYERIKAICQETKAGVRARLGDATRRLGAERVVPVAAPKNVLRDGTLPIEYEGGSPQLFLERFLAAGVAYIEEHYVDGRVEIRRWPAERLAAKSNLVGNIRSKPEYRRGNWQGAGLAKLVMRLEAPGLRAKGANDGIPVTNR
jgi:hypothetical protein